LKKFVLLASVVAIVVAALALPAMASERWDHNDWWKDHDNDNKNSWWDHNDWWKDHHDNDDDDDDDRDRFDRFFDRDFDRFFGGGEVDQSFEQESESGDVDQSFNVSNTGDNSNQCAGVQGVANTGNAQNQISVLQNGSEADDFSFEDSGSSIEVSPNNYTSCDQEVNQAASAAYHGW
jgi:Ni/Co efflux regulator RcnB